MKRRLSAKIVSNKMDKTVVVSVERVKTHPIYKKKYKVNTRFKAHAENSKDLVIGAEAMIEETKPISKDKRWILIDEKANVKGDKTRKKS